VNAYCVSKTWLIAQFASGKTTVTLAMASLLESLGAKCLVLHQDAYFKVPDGWMMDGLMNEQHSS
jgi:uridine kinase